MSKIVAKQGRRKHGWACRCYNKKCKLGYRYRITLPLKPDEYSIRQKRFGQCPSCKRTLGIDKFRTSGREFNHKHCNCGNYISSRGPYIHRKGSSFCVHGEFGKHGWASFHAGSQEFGEWLQEQRAIEQQAA